MARSPPVEAGIKAEGLLESGNVALLKFCKWFESSAFKEDIKALRRAFSAKLEIRISKSEAKNFKCFKHCFENWDFISRLFRISCFEFRILYTIKAHNCEIKTLEPRRDKP
jgi:hypothetical protein